MIPTNFPQATTHFHAPPGYSDEQVQSIPAAIGTLSGGNMDGVETVVVAWEPSPEEWEPSPEEIELLIAGNPVFIGFLGGIPPHFVTIKYPL